MCTPFPTTKCFSALIIPDNAIHKFRHIIMSGLEVIRCKTSGKVTYEVLLDTCVNGAAVMNMVYDTSSLELVGFYVVTPYVKEGVITVDITAAYSIKNCSVFLLRFCLQKAEEFAIIIGATAVTFSSPRRGWLKTAKKLGFESSSLSSEKYQFSKGISYGSHC